MPVPVYQVDAFADAPFAGNPAAVCLLEAPREPAWMQQVAAELNLSETAFVLSRADGGFDLRWFTPAVEVDLCGHATLAAAHVLYETGWLPPGVPALFHTQSGLLTARRDPLGIRLDFPADPVRPVEGAAALTRELEAALGAPVRGLHHGRFDWLAELPDAETVRRLHPDFRRLGALPIRGLIVTAAADGAGCDFVSRFFGPQVGIDEDPVTGSAHCTLGPFWGDRLGRAALCGRQESARGGVVRVLLRGERVDLVGQAVTVLEGVLRP